MVDERLQRHEARLERSQRAWDAARRTYFAGDIGPESFGRDKEHYERELGMLRDEVDRMREAAEDRVNRRTGRRDHRHRGSMDADRHVAELTVVQDCRHVGNRQTSWSII